MSIHGKVIYDSLDEYKVLCKQFKTDLPQLISDNRIDDWTYSDYDYKTKFGIQFSNRFEGVLFEALSTLTKNQVPDWTKSTADILSDAIRGMAKSVSRMKHIRHSVVVCSYCENEEVVEMDEGFEDREVCNIMIVGMINNVLFDTEGEEMGSDECGMLQKVRLFKCGKCSNLVDEIFEEELYNICVNCEV